MEDRMRLRDIIVAVAIALLLNVAVFSVIFWVRAMKKEIAISKATTAYVEGLVEAGVLPDVATLNRMIIDKATKAGKK